MQWTSNCACKTTSKSRKKREIWSFIAFAFYHKNLEAFWIRSTSCTLNPDRGTNSYEILRSSNCTKFSWDAQNDLNNRNVELFSWSGVIYDQNCVLTELKGKCIEMLGNSNCACQTTSKSENNHEIWSFIDFELCHNILEAFGIRSPSWTLNLHLGSKFVWNSTIFKLYEIHMGRTKWC